MAPTEKDNQRVLACPDCGHLHVESAETGRVPHSEHECFYCGRVWKPYEFDTYGVEPLFGSGMCRADEVKPGGLFRKPRGELYYLVVNEHSALREFGTEKSRPSFGKYVYGVSFNGNMTRVERDRIVVRGNHADMVKNSKEYRQFEVSIGADGEPDDDEDEEREPHHSEEFRR